MSYHNDPYRVDYLKIYPCLKERPDVLEVLKKSDRKMKYMEVDLEKRTAQEKCREWCGELCSQQRGFSGAAHIFCEVPVCGRC